MQTPIFVFMKCDLFFKKNSTSNIRLHKRVAKKSIQYNDNGKSEDHLPPYPLEAHFAKEWTAPLQERGVKVTPLAWTQRNQSLI